MFYIKVCQWLDSNGKPLVSEATALPTEPQPLPNWPLLAVTDGAASTKNGKVGLLKCCFIFAAIENTLTFYCYTDTKLKLARCLQICLVCIWKKPALQYNKNRLDISVMLCLGTKWTNELMHGALGTSNWQAATFKGQSYKASTIVEAL